ncbi:MAG TPA: glycosyltransferase [Opitutaceae bacterium]|nr:glycosyltransferase [Opitutaceae bacterium]
MALISVVIPVYNAARFVQSAIGSVLAQSFRDFELIAVDDGSTDSSKALLDALAATDPRIRVISRPNTGIVGALNDGLAAATGEFIARMDADDIALPTRFETQLAYLRAHPGCVALGTDILYTDPEGDPLTRHRPALTHEAIVEQLLVGNGGALIHPTVIFRRQAVESAGRYRQQYNFIEDLDLFLRLSEAGRLANLPDVFLRYRQHLKSVNRTQGTRDALRLQIIAPYREQRNLPVLAPNPIDPHAPQRPADWRRHWAFDAARGGFWASARKNAWLSCLGGPFDRRNWSCLKYTLSSGRTALAASPTA